MVNTAQTDAAYRIQARAEGPALGKTLVTLLENGDTGSGSIPAGPFLGSRQFAIDVPEGIGRLTVALDGDEDVDLFVRYGGPVYLNGTGNPEADIVSTTDSPHELAAIRMANGSNLPAGRYYLGVLNYAERTARFRIQATIEPPAVTTSMLDAPR